MEHDTGQVVIEEKTQEMGMLHVNKFCCCLSIESGALCVAGLHMFASCVLVILTSMFAESARTYIGTVEDAEDHLYTTWYKISIGVAVLSMMHVLLAGLLLISICKRNVIGIRVWLVMMMMLMAAALAFVMINIIENGFSGTGSDIFVSFLEALIFFGVVGYCILTVFSYCLKLTSLQHMAGPGKAEY